MRRLIIFLLVFIFAVFLGLKIVEDPGIAFFSYKQWSVEMPLWFSVAAILLLFFVGYTILRLFDGIDFSIYRFRNWLQWRRKYKSYSKTNRGLVELVEGDWQRAENYLVDGIAQSDAPLINYLAAAKAAHERRAYDKRDSYLRKAHDVAPHAEVAIGLTQAKLQYDEGKFEQALATLRSLRNVAPKNKVVLKMLERLMIHLADWQELLTLVPSLRKVKVVTADEAQALENKVYFEIFKASSNSAQVSFDQSWDAVPRKLQKDPLFIAYYVERLISNPEVAEKLEVLVSQSIKSQWNEELVRLYGLLQAPNPAKQLAKAEKWLKDYSSHAVLYCTLGKLSLRCQLWGKAREYFESAIKLEGNPTTYLEYGALLEMLGEHTAAVKSYREGLALKASQAMLY